MAPPQATNGYDADELAGYLDRIVSIDDELASLKGEYMRSCQGPRQRIKSILSELREGGQNITAFKELLTRERDRRKAEKRVADFEADDRDALELMIEALGDFGSTGLGQAAINRAKGDDTLGGLAQD